MGREVLKQCSLITVPPDPLTFKLRHDLIVSPRRMNISDDYRKTVPDIFFGQCMTFHSPLQRRKCRCIFQNG